MSGISLDTNVIVRLVVKDVPAYTRAASSLLKRHKCYVTDVVATEAVYALERIYALERSEIKTALLYIFRSSQIGYNASLLDSVFDMYEERKSLSFVDCYAALEARSQNRELATFDKNLVKGNAHVKEPR